MASALKAVKPEVVEASKPKFLISGPSGIGKTWFALDFPRPYFMDIEGGAVRPQYREKLKTSGGVYFGKEQGSQDFNAVIEEIKLLATTKHDYRTLIIDSFSHLYNVAAAIAETQVGSDYGKDKKEANKPTRQLIRWLEALDMNVILICHPKEKWKKVGGELTNIGTTFDGYDKMEFILDLWIEVSRTGKDRLFLVKKSRIQSLPQGEVFPLEFSRFSELYGKDVIDQASKPVELVTPEQLEKIKALRETIKTDEDMEEKVFKKFGVDSWEELKKENAQVVIDALNKKLSEVNKGGK